METLDHSIITCTTGQQVMVSMQDFDWLSGYSWSVSGQKRNYPYATINGVKTKMYRLIMGVTNPKIEVDHKDRNPLNNKRDNLRIATRTNNSGNLSLSVKNTSGFKGVSYARNRNKWEAKIKKSGRTIHLGRFTTAVEAARAYSTAAKEYFGEFAYIPNNHLL